MEPFEHRVSEILQALNSELPQLMQRAADTALDSTTAQLLIRELESLGFRLQVEIQPTLMAVPLEIAFERELTENDHGFLRRLRVKVGD